jgi:hypothetical protein
MSRAEELLEDFKKFTADILSDELKSIDFLLSSDVLEKDESYDKLLLRRKDIIRKRKLERILNYE